MSPHNAFRVIFRIVFPGHKSWGMVLLRHEEDQSKGAGSQLENRPQLGCVPILNPMVLAVGKSREVAKPHPWKAYGNACGCQGSPSNWSCLMMPMDFFTCDDSTSAACASPGGLGFNSDCMQVPTLTRSTHVHTYTRMPTLHPVVAVTQIGPGLIQWKQEARLWRDEPRKATVTTIQPGIWLLHGHLHTRCPPVSVMEQRAASEELLLPIQTLALGSSLVLSKLLHTCL